MPDPATPPPEAPAETGERRDAWVDFNDVDRDGLTTTLRNYVESDVEIRFGRRVVVGDDEGNRAVGSIIGEQDGLVTIAVAMQTFRAASDV